MTQKDPHNLAGAGVLNGKSFLLTFFYVYTDEEIYDETFLTRLQLIKENLERGEAIVRDIKKRTFQVLRKFRMTLMNLLNEEFCIDHESYGNVKMDWDTLEKRITAAYQLRSSYVHTGKRFDRGHSK